LLGGSLLSGFFGGSRFCGLRIDEEFSSACLSAGAIRFCSIALLAAIGEATSVDVTFAETSVGAITNASENDRVWFVVYSYDAPPNTVEKSVLSTFNETHTITYVKSYEGYRVYLLETRA
jgi:hypothetical protein